MNRLNNKSIVETLGSSDYVAAIKDNKVVRLKVEFLLNQYGGPSGTLAPADADPEPAVPSWFFGTGPGNYTNLGINTTADIVFLVWDGTAWSAVEIDLDLSTVEANVEAAVSAKAEADAIQLLRMHDPNLVFSGFVNTSTATPSHTANKAYIATESGTIFGIYVAKGQIIKDNGVNFIAESISLKVDATSIKQTTGTSETDVMSQKAVTDEIAQLSGDVIVGWVLSESFSISNPEFSEGNISGGVITWADGDVGSISDVVVGEHGITSIRYNRSDEKYATMNVTYDAFGNVSNQEVVLTGF